MLKSVVGRFVFALASELLPARVGYVTEREAVGAAQLFWYV